MKAGKIPNLKPKITIYMIPNEISDFFHTQKKSKFK